MRISDWSSDVCSCDLRCNRYPVVAAPQEPDLVVLWNIGIEEQQFPFKLLPDRGAKRLRIWRQAEAGIVRISPDLEVLGKIVIGIAIAIRPEHPDFFGADAVAQLRQDAKLIADPVYPPIVINDGNAPSRWKTLIARKLPQWQEPASATPLSPSP